MECRILCGACCIVPSISSAIPGMPEGKPAGVRCIHLNKNLRCEIFETSDRPEVCDKFQADPMICGTCRDEAIHIFCDLEGICTESVRKLF